MRGRDEGRELAGSEKGKVGEDGMCGSALCKMRFDGAGVWNALPDDDLCLCLSLEMHMSGTRG